MFYNKYDLTIRYKNNQILHLTKLQCRYSDLLSACVEEDENIEIYMENSMCPLKSLQFYLDFNKIPHTSKQDLKSAYYLGINEIFSKDLSDLFNDYFRMFGLKPIDGVSKQIGYMTNSKKLMDKLRKVDFDTTRLNDTFTMMVRNKKGDTILTKQNLIGKNKNEIFGLIDRLPVLPVNLTTGDILGYVEVLSELCSNINYLGDHVLVQTICSLIGCLIYEFNDEVQELFTPGYIKQRIHEELLKDPSTPYRQALLKLDMDEFYPDNVVGVFFRDAGILPERIFVLRNTVGQAFTIIKNAYNKHGKYNFSKRL